MSSTAKRTTNMPPKPKLRSVKPTAKDEIAALKERLAAAEAQAAQIQEALKLLGLSVLSEIVPAIKELRTTLEMEDTDKRRVDGIVAELMDESKHIDRYRRREEASEVEMQRLDEALTATREDRAALLKHAGLTARQWWDLGGAHEAHLEAHSWEE